MATRIFPTQKNEKVENSSVIKTIGVDQLSQEMNKLANVKAEMTKTAAVKKTAKDRKKKKYEVRDICEECGVEHPCSCDVTAAQAAGDKEAVQAMLEVRENRRLAQIQQLEEVEEAEALNQRTAYRNQLLNDLQKLAADETEENSEKTAGKIKGPGIPDGTGPWGGTEKCPIKPKKDKDKDEDDDDDNKKEDKDEDEKESCSKVKLTQMSSKQKSNFQKYAEAMGWPVEYVKAVTEETIKTAAIDDATKIVLANKSLDKNSKKELVIAMHKEAKLSQEQASRIREYWVNELGYQDAEWVGDLVEEPTGK